MSDTGRQTMGDKVHSAVVPDSTKSTTEKAHDATVGSVDNAAAHAQPESTKSTTQKMADSVTTGTGSTDAHAHAHTNDASVMDKVKHAFGMDNKN